jgi:hypothetical protein
MTREDQRVLKRIGLEAEIVYPPMILEQFPDKKEMAVSVNDEGLIDQLKKAMPDYKFYLKDLSCPITIHFEDTISNIISSICNGNWVISNTNIFGVEHIQGFQNIPELRKMLVHGVRKANKVSKLADESLISDYKNQVNPNTFYRKLRKIADKEINKYARFEQIEGTA